MNTFASSAEDARGVANAAFEIFKMTSKPWYDMFNGALNKSGESAPGGAAAWPAAEFWKQWSPWPGNIFKGAAVPQREGKSMLSACLEQQQRCSRLASAWYSCAMEMMGVMRNSFQSGQGAEEVLNECREAAEEYTQACRAFMDSQCAQLLQAWGMPGPAAAGAGKAETAPSRSPGEAKAPERPGPG